MSSLQLYIDSGLKNDLIYSPFYEKAKDLDFQALAFEELDLKKFLVALCPLSSYESLMVRFRYYRHVWFVCLDDDSSNSQTPNGEHVFILSPGQENSLRSLIAPLSHLAELINQEELEQTAKLGHKELAKQAERYLDLVYNSFKYQLSQGSLATADDQVDEMSDFFLARRSLLELEKESEVFEACSHSFKRWEITGFKVIKANELLELSQMTQEKHLVVSPVGMPQESYYYIWYYKGLQDAKLCFYIYNLMLSLEKFYLRENRQKEMTSEESLWEQVFQVINVPMVLLSPQGDILVHNNEFTRLNVIPRDCLGFEDGKKIEADAQVWNISREDFNVKNNKLSLFVFQTTSKDGLNVQGIKSGELGIISGSIAHELNNPLGGILACLSLLELEDDWSEDGRSSLDDMRKGAQRCKDLVEIFLGFSRASPEGQGSGGPEKSMEQALNLLRFRMIESGLRVSVDFKTLQRLEKSTNTSVMAMVFYLILNEVMTVFSHQDLVQVGKGEQNKLDVLCEEGSDRVVLSFNNSLDELSKVLDSKLVHHLLEIEGFELESNARKITLFRNVLF
jgi:hypothetical protein